VTALPVASGTRFRGLAWKGVLAAEADLAEALGKECAAPLMPRPWPTTAG
jgi:hypothetical protein